MNASEDAEALWLSVSACPLRSEAATLADARAAWCSAGRRLCRSRPAPGGQTFHARLPQTRPRA